MLAMFFPPSSEDAIYFLLDPATNRIARCNETGLIRSGEWTDLSPQQFVKKFWNGKNVSALGKIIINGHYLSDFKREFLSSINSFCYYYRDAFAHASTS